MTTPVAFSVGEFARQMREKARGLMDEPFWTHAATVIEDQERRLSDVTARAERAEAVLRKIAEHPLSEYTDDTGLDFRGWVLDAIKKAK